MIHEHLLQKYIQYKYTYLKIFIIFYRAHLKNHKFDDINNIYLFMVIVKIDSRITVFRKETSSLLSASSG